MIVNVILLVLLVPVNVHASVITLYISGAGTNPQTISQGQTATYDIGISAFPVSTAYTFSASGVVGSFTPNPVMVNAAGLGSTELVVDASTPPTYCPGTYSFDGGAQSGNQITVTMNDPHTAVADYKAQYFLSIETFRKNGIGVKTPVWFAQEDAFVGSLDLAKIDFTRQREVTCEEPFYMENEPIM